MAIDRTERVRALVAVGIAGTPVVLATDSAALAWDASEINDRCDDLAFPDCPGRGLWLFEGEQVVYSSGPNYETGTEYRGAYHTVGPAELAGLLAMEPPPPADEVSP